MSTALQKAESLLAQMSPGEKAQLLQWVVSDLGGVFPESKKHPAFAAAMHALPGHAFRFGCLYVNAN